MQRQLRTSDLASPSRALTEAFLCKELPRLLPIGEVSVLDIGCGAGSLSLLLAELGYWGTYVGIDVVDAFDRKETLGFNKQLIVIDAHRFDSEKKFDLIISVSALEHIPDDTRLIPKLTTFLTARGLQLHFVPSSWALFLYLWHGYRQYTMASLSKRFDTAKTETFSLGGLTSFLLHFSLITIWEIFFRVNLRRKFPTMYSRLLDLSLLVDRYLPIFSAFYAVVSRATSSTQK
jgi:SAM-dependent methyltransferase